VAFAPPDTKRCLNLHTSHGSDPQPLRTFIGDCYVHGVMDREPVKKHKNDVSPIYLI
jgi:hypothetical protein